MKKLAHLGFSAALMLTLSGCNLVQALQPDTTQNTFRAASYLGKELPPAFLANQYRLNQDNGNGFRGYHLGQRHWKF